MRFCLTAKFLKHCQKIYVADTLKRGVKGIPPLQDTTSDSIVGILPFQIHPNLCRIHN